MESEINNISLHKEFWIQISERFVSFGCKFLPEDVHYTFSYHPNSEEVNIHLTRNVGAENDKPKIVLVRLNKKVLETVAPYSVMQLINCLLKPIDLSPYLENDSEVNFIPIEPLQNGETARTMQDLLIEGFRPISKIKKRTQLKLDGDIKSTFENLYNTGELISTLQSITIKIKDIINSNCQGGFILSDGEVRAIIRYNGSWYELKNDVSPFELLSVVVEKKWAAIILRNTKRALAKIRKATSYKETEPWNTPVLLGLNPEFEKAITA